MDAGGDGAPPLCAVCSHKHDQEAKCHICGHIARRRPLERVRVLPPTPYAFSVQSYDGAPRGKVSAKALRHNAGLQVFTRLLRSRIFPGLPFDHAAEQQYRHLVAFVGDAPVGTARWQIVSENGASMAIVEHFGILEDKRRRGLGKQLLQAIVEDVKASATEWQTCVDGIVAHIPERDSVVGIKMLQVSGFQLDPQPRIVNDEPCMRMVLM